MRFGAERVDHAIEGLGLPGVDEQVGEQHAALRATDLDRLGSGTHLERSEHKEAQTHRRTSVRVRLGGRTRSNAR